MSRSTTSRQQRWNWTEHRLNAPCSDVILPFHNHQIQATPHEYDEDANSYRTSGGKEPGGQENDSFYILIYQNVGRTQQNHIP